MNEPSATKYGALKAVAIVGKIASYSGMSINVINIQLYEEFKNFSQQCRRFGLSAKIDELPSKWWNSKIEDGSILEVVALRLANLRSSSANIPSDESY